MNIDYVKKIVADIEGAKGDDETAHGIEDGLRHEFIEFIANSGPPDLAAMAREVLKSGHIEFCRWCA
jgi:hypothetical protein